MGKLGIVYFYQEPDSKIKIAVKVASSENPNANKAIIDGLYNH
jgi:hypothetical protein